MTGRDVGDVGRTFARVNPYVRLLAAYVRVRLSWLSGGAG